MIKRVGDREMRHVSSLQVWSIPRFLSPQTHAMQQDQLIKANGMQTQCNACKHNAMQHACKHNIQTTCSMDLNWIRIDLNHAHNSGQNAMNWWHEMQDNACSCIGPSTKHKDTTLKHDQKVTNMKVWQHYMLWNQEWNDTKSSKQHKHSMLEGLRHKATKRTTHKACNTWHKWLNLP